MRLLPVWSIILLAVAGSCFAASRADEIGPTRRHHPWGRCAPGAWKIVCVVTKAIDERGMVSQTSTTETKTTLAEIGEDGVTLEIRAVVEAAGRRFDPEPQVIKQAFHGELAGRDVKFKQLAAESVMIEEAKILCHVVQMEFETASSKTVTTVHYADNFPPYILRRTSVTTNAEGTEVLSETIVEVVTMNMPCDVLGEVKSAAEVRTVHRHPNGTVTTLAFVSPDVPGGVVSHTSKELDRSGRLTRQSVLKLVSYSFEPEEERTGLFGRKRPSRFRKSTSH